MQTTVLGAGTIGSTIAYDLVTGTPSVDVTLVDVDEQKAKGHALDATHAAAHISHPAGKTGRDGQGMRPVTVDPPGPDALVDTDCIVMTASAPRPEGAENRGTRIKWLEENLEVIEKVSSWMREVDPKPVLVVTNPMDVITHLLHRESGWSREYFLGYSLSETARLADYLASTLEVPHQSVSCPVLGEHGEHMVPIFSHANVDGESITLPENERMKAIDYMRSIPFDIHNMRGSSESSRWVTGCGAALIVRTLLRGGTNRPIDLSTPLDGEYGCDDVCLSVPLTFDENGVNEIIEWDLSKWEHGRLDDAYRSVKSNLSTVE